MLEQAFVMLALIAGVGLVLTAFVPSTAPNTVSNETTM